MHPFWHPAARTILRGRIPIVLGIALLTALMWHYRGQNIDQSFGRIVPASDPESRAYDAFKAEFGSDGDAVVIAISGEVFSQRGWEALFELTRGLEGVEGVRQVLSPARLIDIVRNDSLERFEMERLFPRPPRTSVEADSFFRLIKDRPFYRGIVLSNSGNTALVAANIESALLDTKYKITVYDSIYAQIERYVAQTDTEVRIAGMPTLRVNIHKVIARELVLFLILALAVMAVTLLLFFRSLATVFLPLVVVGIVVVWSVGIIGLLGYNITLMTGLVPALVTVIGIPNSVYLITKYHIEYLRTRNKIKSLMKVIERIGWVTILTNATTAVGFGVLAFTDIKMLREFGIVSSLSVVAAFFISLMLIPISFSFLPAPTKKQLRHLNRRPLNAFIRLLDRWVVHRRRVIYGIAIGLAIFAIGGMVQLTPVSFITDDIPEGSRLIQDLRYVESEFGGVMPFEILIETGKRRGAMKRKNLQKTAELQDRLAAMPELSRTVSLADVAKFARQRMMNADARGYVLPQSSEYNFMQLYLRNADLPDAGFNESLTDSNLSKIRVTGNIRDIGSLEMGRIVDSIQRDLAELFPPEESYKTQVTGITKLFVRGNEFLIVNLLESLALAFLIIAILMGLLFRSWRMVFISLVPNFLPLMLVAGFMGYLDIALKPSSALVFSVAFGIAVDDSIHFLARYRMARRFGDTIREAVSNSFRDTGVSMIYTSLILFCGFAMFTASEFGGTHVLGLLTSATLLFAMFGNLVLLPSLLISFDREEPKKRQKQLIRP